MSWFVVFVVFPHVHGNIVQKYCCEYHTRLCCLPPPSSVAVFSFLILLDFFALFQVLQAFQTDPGVKVLLISLKAGGVALNLTVANHIFLMDP